MILYVAPFGQRSWNGIHPDITPDGKDGPLPSIPQALEMARRLREQNLHTGSITIQVRGGRYELLTPMTIDPDHDNVRIEAYPGEEPILDGSVHIRSWEEQELNGNPVWVADVSLYAEFLKNPRSLTVNDEVRPRSRYPKEGWMVIEDVPDLGEEFELFDGSRRFICAEGDFDPTWRHPNRIDAVVNHLWVEERMPIEHFDPEQRLATSSHFSIFTLKNKGWMGSSPCARYYLENVFEAMSEPGEWYFDPEEARLYYMPKSGETLENCSIRIPHLLQLLRVHGEDGTPVRNVHLSGLRFVNTDFAPSEGWGLWWDPGSPASSWRPKHSFRHFHDTVHECFRQTPWPKDVKLAAVPQIAHDLPGALSFQQAKDCSLSQCSLQAIGFYGVDVRFGCSHLRFQDNQLEGMGSGGFKVDGADARGPEAERTHHIAIADNRILRSGRIYSSAAGIAVLHSGRNRIEHNEIAYQPYSAISIGWQWDYDENIAKENLILNNYIHHLGLGIMSDLGGIYTLGCLPGTLIKGNVIHDVQSSHYGGNGIYLDEGSACIRVEQNVVLRVNGRALFEHWGRQNVYRHNLFALGSREMLELAREEGHGLIAQPLRGALFQQNVVVSKGVPLWQDQMTYLESNLLESSLNLYWDLEKQEQLELWHQNPWPGVEGEQGMLGLNELQARGLDIQSQVADPELEDLENLKLDCPENSPLRQLGIRLMDPTQAGPRDAEARILEAQRSFRSSAETTFGDG